VSRQWCLVVRFGLPMIALISISLTSTGAAPPDSTLAYRDLDCDGFDDRLVIGSSLLIPDIKKPDSSIKPDSRLQTPAVHVSPATNRIDFGSKWRSMLDLVDGQFNQLSPDGIGCSDPNSNSSVCPGGICIPR
jgi:hypothetical protein